MEENKGGEEILIGPAANDNELAIEPVITKANVRIKPNLRPT